MSSHARAFVRRCGHDHVLPRGPWPRRRTPWANRPLPIHRIGRYGSLPFRLLVRVLVGAERGELEDQPEQPVRQAVAGSRLGRFVAVAEHRFAP